MADSSSRARTREATFPFTFERSETDGDGLTFEGYAAVYNSPTEISDQRGEYIETIAPGAFTRTMNAKTPVFMFNHGRHPLIGNMPLGKITDWRDDPRGLWIQARFSDNWLIEPVRCAIRDQAVDGMSFKFEVIRDRWMKGPNGTRMCALQEVRVPELGPVIMPAYEGTTASVRSALEALEEKFPGAVTIQVRDDETEISTQDTTVSDLVSDAIESKWGLADQNTDAYIIDFFDDHVVFVVVGKDKHEYSGLWTVDYSYADGNVTIGTPAHPQISVSTGANSQEPEGVERAWSDHVNLLDGERAKYDTAARKKMAGSGQAMSDGSYPIADAEDLNNAIHAVGRGSGSHNAIRAHIIRRAKALGLTKQLPPNWTSSGANSQSTSEELAERTSEEPATAEEPMSKEQVIRAIQLRALGIPVP